MSYFPLFVDTKTANFLVIGAGNVGLAKLQAILEFTSNVAVLAKDVNGETLNFITKNNIKFFTRVISQKASASL